MGKQKYPTTDNGTVVAGERKHREHKKTGKLDKHREARRLEAIQRQVARIQTLEAALEKAKDKGKYQKALTHAQLTLQQIRGGVPHPELHKRFNNQTNNDQSTTQEQSI